MRPARADGRGGAEGGMQVWGMLPDGRTAFSADLPHGTDPTVLSHDHGFRVLRPLEAVADADGELLLRLRVAPVAGQPRPPVPRRGADPDLRLPPGARPTPVQRVAAYAVVVSERGLLATRYSDRTAVDGRWGMPGGGLDPGEAPVDAVLREVHEETAQVVEVGLLELVQTSHWVGRSPRGELEDFQAVRLVYRAGCPHPTDPRVLDVGGTTADARWVPLDRWRTLPWTHNWEQALSGLLEAAPPES